MRTECMEHEFIYGRKMPVEMLIRQVADSINDDFTDFKFVFVISFKESTIAVLENLAQIVSKRQLAGASKFYC